MDTDLPLSHRRRRLTLEVMRASVHHVELWTHDLAAVTRSWDWLFRMLAWEPDDGSWADGRIWTNPSGTYVVLEQSPALTGNGHDRMSPGMNHLALTVPERSVVQELRAEAAEHGWRELFAGAYPHAGGEQHVALFLENDQGFEVELVATGKTADSCPGRHARPGPRPRTSTEGPHRQLDQLAPSALWGELVQRVFALDEVVEGHSQVSPASSRAVFLTDLQTSRSPQMSLALGGRLEPVHLHGVEDTSVHLCLPATRGQELVELGWAEPHSYADHDAELMVYGPRTSAELDVVVELVRESIAFARPRLTRASPSPAPNDWCTIQHTRARRAQCTRGPNRALVEWDPAPDGANQVWTEPIRSRWQPRPRRCVGRPRAAHRPGWRPPR